MKVTYQFKQDTKDDDWGEQSTVRFGARRESNSNTASFVLQTADVANVSAGERLVDRLVVNSSGNIGIGTDAATKLDIAGNVRASSIDLNTDIGYSAVFSKQTVR